MGVIMLVLKNKTKFLAAFVCVLSIVIANSGGPSGNYANNAPSYNNCTSCHSGAINTGNGAVEILGLPADGYVPGESYSLTISVTGTHERGYCFQMASQTGNNNAGTFSLGSSSENAELNGNRVQHSTRTISGEWILEWLAPSSDVGDITFSISGLATGGNNGNVGDDVYTGAIEVPAFVPVVDPDITLISDIQNSSSAGSGDNGSSKTRTQYDMAVSHIKAAKKLEEKDKLKKAKKRYEKAQKLLMKSNKKFPNKADTLNYLGFTTRKLGDFENGEKYYLQGLAINPYHIGINEYLGELYVATKRHNLAV